MPFLFFIVAFVYAMAGFGGGSTYTALLVSAGLPGTAVRFIALCCNLLVSGQGAWMLLRSIGARATRPLLLPLLLGSVPAAFVAGRWRMEENFFLVLLAGALFLAALLMFWQPPPAQGETRKASFPLLFGLGALLGTLAGLTGIGGGIYLAPVLHLARLATPRVIAACTSLFIVANSLAGLGGLLSMQEVPLAPEQLRLLGFCALAVLIGGQLGSRFISKKLSPPLIRRVTASIILLVAIRVGWQLVHA